MDPRVSVFNDDQEKVWSGFWQIQYNLQTFDIDTKDFIEQSDDGFQQLITNVRNRFDDPRVEKLLDKQIAGLADLLDTGKDLPTLRKAVVQYIESTPETLGCFDMNVLYGPYFGETLPARLNEIVKRHVAGCLMCSNLIAECETAGSD